MTKRINLKVSVSGVRGIVGDYLTPSLVSDFAASFGEYVGGGRVVIGRDTRNTGSMLEHAVIAGLLSVGCQPVLLGVVPTPTVLIMVDEMSANGGIAITASHNPIEWNALKFISSSGVFMNYTEAAELLNVYNQPDTTYINENDYRNLRNFENAFNIHKKRIFKNINLEAIRQSRFKVAVDCCNGVGALFSRLFLEELGCEVFTVHDEAHGSFDRSPEPIPKNLEALGKTVRQQNCMLGFAQDPDGDRLALVNSKGEPVGEQYSLVLAAEHTLSKTPGNVVVNIQTSKAVADIASKYNSEVHYSKVGEINVTSKMLDLDAIIGGEGGSGGVIWPTVHPCRDSFAGMAIILEMMAERKQTFNQLMDEMPKYVTKNLKVPCSAEKSLDIVRHLRSKYLSDNPITVDGIRLDWEDSWVLIRPSNTEPVIRITTEAQTEEKAQQLLDTFAREIN